MRRRGRAGAGQYQRKELLKDAATGGAGGWQRDLAENDGPISEHFDEHTPLTVEEIDDLCERLN